MAKIEIESFDVADYLTSEEEIAGYIGAAINEIDEPGGIDGLLLALRTVARVRGMAEIARQAGLGRESLYKTLAPGSHPRFETITALLHALNLHLTLVPDHDSADLETELRA
jgi:probable addiction module antidote protein